MPTDLAIEFQAMGILPTKRFLWVMTLCSFGLPTSSFAEQVASESRQETESRPFHFLLQSGGYLSLGGPAGYGPSLALEVLPGSFAERFGVRAEWRGSRGYSEGTALAALLFEAAASRPKLVLKLLAEVGLTQDKNPVLGAGIEWSLWVLGPLGVSTITTLDIVVDGSDTRPALRFGLNIHLGR